jgi:His/Glu/Gln/Arg/opine family amino acid ABC transporter permease subunit
LDEALSTPNRRTVRFKVELPEDAWYAVRVLRDDTGEPVYREIDGVRLPISPARPLPNTGYAWVRLDGVATFSTRSDNLQHLTERYGELPAYPCPTTRECRRQVAENDLRFDGARTFGEFVRIQLDPFLQGIAAPLVVGFVVLCIGWIVGRFAKQNRNPRTGKWVSSLTIVGWLALFPLSWIILGGFDDSQAIHPNLIMPKVPTNVWGGLVLTILLTFVAITASFPIGVVLALGRRSQLPIISLFSTLFIEVVRGVPLITILFMAKFIVRYFADSLSEMELIVRLMIGLTLFTAAYVAEIVRGGLQIIPKGQIEASEALGLNPFLTNTFIVLPQALRAVIPALMSQFVSLFKDTTLVSIVGSFELLGMVEIIVTGQQIYRPFQREAYLFVGAIYFILSFVMSSVSRRLEETGSGTTRRLR